MSQMAHEAYLESRVLSADPLELVRMLYGGAIAAVRDACAHLAAGDIASRSRAITKAAAILLELAATLDHARGGELSARLARLYEYMQARLIEANVKQADAPLGEVLDLLGTLAEAWEGIAPAGKAAAAAAPEDAWLSGLPAEAAVSAVAAGWRF